MAERDPLESRIDDRARALWREAGEPEGRLGEYRDRAAELVAIEDSQNKATRTPEEAERAEDPVEPLEAIENTGDYPGVTDQGERSSGPVRRGTEERKSLNKS